MTIETIREKLYADSPYNLGSRKDNEYRNGVDSILHWEQRRVKTARQVGIQTTICRLLDEVYNAH